MKEIQYKTFSLRTHKKNWRLNNPNVCQFELTFRCNLHCKHCYTDCYNKAIYLKKELDTRGVKFILDKVYQIGAIWLCFTGGDPLTRGDFLDIYSYAKDKGFIITVFTNGHSMTQEIAKYFRERPPFAIEMTLNAATEDLYERISQVNPVRNKTPEASVPPMTGISNGVKGSFGKVMKGINLILKEKLPLKIKTQIIKDNLRELPRIEKFIKGLGLKFQPSSDLYARLNGDSAPCNLRISPQEVLNLNGRVRTGCLNEPNEPNELNKPNKPNERNKPNNSQFRCAIGGGDGINLDPYGNMFLCNLIRKPYFNLLKVDIEYAFNKLLPLVRNRNFISNSKCKGCNLRESCHWCPGRAYLETGDEEASMPYYCEMAKLVHRRQKSKVR